jgi:hypothetical protein
MELHGIQGTFDGGGFAQLMKLDREATGAQRFYKALTAGAGTDVSLLTGGAALRRESLEASVLKTVQKMKHFGLWNKVAKTPATATVDEWTQLRDIGGIPGSGAVGELATIPENTGDYQRKVGLVKFLKDRRRVSVEAEVQSQSGLAGAIATETDNGTRKLLTDAEWLSFYGNSDMQPAEFDGLVKILEDEGGDHVLDIRGRSISADAREFVSSAELIWGQGNWGMATDIFLSGAAQADLNIKINPALRIILDQNPKSIEYGAHVRGITTGFGDLMTNPDPFITESGMPYVARGGNYALQLAASSTTLVDTIAGVPGADADSLFDAATAGNYYYAVEAGRAEGRSALVKSAQVAVAAGESVVVTITPNATNNATYYALYRSRQDGTNANNDFREVARIAADGDNPVTYTDQNQNIPGTSPIFVLTIDEQAIVIRRLLPQMRFPLFPQDTAEHIWAQLLFCYLRVGKENQHRLIKNFLPTQATWRPHG